MSAIWTPQTPTIITSAKWLGAFMATLRKSAAGRLLKNPNSGHLAKGCATPPTCPYSFGAPSGPDPPAGLSTTYTISESQPFDFSGCGTCTNASGEPEHTSTTMTWGNVGFYRWTSDTVQNYQAHGKIVSIITLEHTRWQTDSYPGCGWRLIQQCDVSSAGGGFNQYYRETYDPDDITGTYLLDATSPPGCVSASPTITVS